MVGVWSFFREVSCWPWVWMSLCLEMSSRAYLRRGSRFFGLRSCELGMGGVGLLVLLFVYL